MAAGFPGQYGRSREHDFVKWLKEDVIYLKLCHLKSYTLPFLELEEFKKLFWSFSLPKFLSTTLWELVNDHMNVYKIV